MSVIRGSAYPKYEGLLPIEPPAIVFRPIDLNSELIDLNSEDVPIPNGRRSAWGLRLLIVFCTGVAATLLWYGDAAREMIANPYLLFAPRPAPTAQDPRLPDVITLASPTAPTAEQPNAMSFGLDAVGQNDNISTTPTTATRVDQAPAAKAGSVTVKNQGDAASSQSVVPLNTTPIEAKPPEMLSEKGKPLAARPRGSDHRRGGTTENALTRSRAPRPQAWGFGLP